MDRSIDQSSRLLNGTEQPHSGQLRIRNCHPITHSQCLSGPRSISICQPLGGNLGETSTTQPKWQLQSRPGRETRCLETFGENFSLVATCISVCETVWNSVTAYKSLETYETFTRLFWSRDVSCPGLGLDRIFEPRDWWKCLALFHICSCWV